jgi:hypothetical protein
MQQCGFTQASMIALEVEFRVCRFRSLHLEYHARRNNLRERTLMQDAAIEMHSIGESYSYLKFARSLAVENGAAATL